MPNVSNLVEDRVDSDFYKAFSASGSSCLWQTTAMVNVKSRAAQRQPLWAADQDRQVRACRLYISLGSLWSWVQKTGYHDVYQWKTPWFAIFIARLSSYAWKPAGTARTANCVQAMLGVWNRWTRSAPWAPPGPPGPGCWSPPRSPACLTGGLSSTAPPARSPPWLKGRRSRRKNGMNYRLVIIFESFLSNLYRHVSALTKNVLNYYIWTSVSVMNVIIQERFAVIRGLIYQADDDSIVSAFGTDWYRPSQPLIRIGRISFCCAHSRVWPQALTCSPPTNSQPDDQPTSDYYYWMLCSEDCEYSIIFAKSKIYDNNMTGASRYRRWCECGDFSEWLPIWKASFQMLAQVWVSRPDFTVRASDSALLCLHLAHTSWILYPSLERTARGRFI